MPWVRGAKGRKQWGSLMCVCVYIYIYIYFFFFFHKVFGILVPQPVIEPRPQQWKWWVLTTGHPRDTLAVCNSKQSFQDRPVTWIKTCRNWGRWPTIYFLLYHNVTIIKGKQEQNTEGTIKNKIFKWYLAVQSLNCVQLWDPMDCT